MLTALRQRLLDVDATIVRIRASGRDDDETLDELSRAKQRREVLQGQITELEAAERRQAADRTAVAERRERQRVERELQDRRDELSRRWAVWGRTMTEVDERARALWSQYKVLATDALVLAKDAAVVNLEIKGPDTSPAHQVMASISSGNSPIRDWRR